MRRLAYLFLLAIAPLSAGAQAYGRIDFSLQNAQGPAIAGASINVLAQSACGVTASGNAQLYSSATGGPISQPLHTDGFGHAAAYTLPGCVTIVYNSPSTGTLTYPDQTVFSGTGAYCTITDCVALITPAQDLQSAITAAGAGGQLQLSCGTFNVPAGLLISNASVHIHGPGRYCGIINFTSASGLLISGTKAEIDNLTFQGATSGHTVEIANTAAGARFHDNIVTGSGSAGGAISGSTALLIDAPNTDIWVEDNELYGNGTASGDGYVVRTDGAAAGYVQKLHMRRNWIHGNTAGGGAYLFDIANSDVSDNTIDQNNQCTGGSCIPGLNGIGYALASYSEAFMNPTSLSRTSGVVTAVGTVGFTSQWPLNVGDQVFLQVADFGAGGTDFNGVFAVTSISVDRKTITWALFLRCHLGFGPYGFYKESGATTNFLIACLLMRVSMESCGNGSFYDENAAGLIAGSRFICCDMNLDTTNAYEISSRTTYGAIYCGNMDSCEFDGEADPYTNGYNRSTRPYTTAIIVVQQGLTNTYFKSAGTLVTVGTTTFPAVSSGNALDGTTRFDGGNVWGTFRTIGGAITASTFVSNTDYGVVITPTATHPGIVGLALYAASGSIGTAAVPVATGGVATVAKNVSTDVIAGGIWLQIASSTNGKIIAFNSASRTCTVGRVWLATTSGQTTLSMEVDIKGP